jgi:hypothetical protein
VLDKTMDQCFHELAYTNAQEHDKRVDFFRYNREALDAVLNNPTDVLVTRAMLALKRAGEGLVDATPIAAGVQNG